MATVIYRVLLTISAVLIVFFLGAMVGIANPDRLLLITVVATAILIIGFVLGKSSQNENHKEEGE